MIKSVSFQIAIGKTFSHFVYVLKGVSTYINNTCIIVATLILFSATWIGMPL